MRKGRSTFSLSLMNQTEVTQTTQDFIDRLKDDPYEFIQTVRLLDQIVNRARHHLQAQGMEYAGGSREIEFIAEALNKHPEFTAEAVILSATYPGPLSLK